MTTVFCDQWVATLSGGVITYALESCGGGGFNPWVSGNTVEVGDVVAYEGRVYQANTAHTATTFSADRAFWDVIVYLPLSLWTANTFYYANEEVYINSKVYTRNVTGTSGATFDLVEETAWTEVVAGSALPYTQYFNNTSDWTLNGAYYEQTVLAATHGYGTDIATINFYELVGADYVSVVVDEVIVNATGDVTFRVPVSPAGRFPGKVVIGGGTGGGGSPGTIYASSVINVSNEPGGDIASVTVQGAINELDSEKVNRNGDTMTGDLSVPDDVYDASWNGNLEVPTKNALYDKIQTLGGTSVNFVFSEVPTEPINSANTVFTTANAFTAGTTRVYLNGIRQYPGTDYTITGANQITFSVAPTTGDLLLIDYHY